MAQIRRSKKQLHTSNPAPNGPVILLAEDNPTNQEVIRRQLALLGYRCDIAKAYEMLQKKELPPVADGLPYAEVGWLRPDRGDKIERGKGWFAQIADCGDYGKRAAR